MNLLTIAEQLASLDLSPIHVDADRCLHAIDPHSTCDQCVKTCPTQALSLSKSITLKAESCARCGQCLHDCPVGALTGPDKVAEVWTLALRPAKARTLEVACLRHPSPELGPSSTDAVLRLGTCLAALSPSAYVGLLSLGLDQITVRLDRCGACPIGNAKAAIERTIAIARQLLAARQEADRIKAVDIDHGRGWTHRPVYAKNTDLSRRDLFQHFVSKRQPQIERAVQVLDAPQDGGQSSNAKRPPRERKRVLNALRRLPPVTLAPSPLEHLPFARIAVDENCSACGACARICPTGALNLIESGDNRYQLTFTIGDCINCGVCVKVCAPEALRREDPTLGDLLETGPVTLRAGASRQCAKCGAKFASATENPLCPLCDFRRQQPFGSQLPPGLLKQLAAAKRTIGGAT